MPAQTLRPYQESGLANVLQAYRDGARSVIMILPTGGGKTTAFVSLMTQVPSALLLVHRRELATQAAARLREFGADFGFIMSGEPSKPYAKIQIASVATLVRRKAPPASLVVCDEAHLSTAATWNQILSQYQNAKILGVTATPWRLGGKPLHGAYDASVVVATPAQLREQGFLCGYSGFSYKTPDLSGVKTTAGEYNEKQSAAAMGQSLIVDSIVQEWLKHASTLSTVVFAVTVEHSKALCAKFVAAGVKAEHLDGSTSLDTRKAILRRVESGITRVLCNVGVAVEGLDIPRLKCCVLARPTKSLARAIQMMGRVRRPWNGVEARLHDHAFVIGQHGLPDDERDYTLTAKVEAPPNLRRCEECGAYFRGVKCTACAHENVVIEVGARKLNTIDDAEKIEFASGSEAVTAEPAKPVAVKWITKGRVVEGVLVKRWDENTAWGKQRMYRLRTDAKEYDLPGTTVLNARLGKVRSGTQVRVTYLGETALGDFKARKEFSVEADDGT